MSLTRNTIFANFFVASAACPDPAGAVQPPVTRPVLVARKRGLNNSLGSPAGDSAFDRQVDTTLPSLSEHRNERQESCASRPGSSAESEDYRDDSFEAQCDHCASSEEDEDDRDEQEQDRDEQEEEKDRDKQEQEKEEDRDEQEQEESNDDTGEEQESDDEKQESDDEKQQASPVEEQESVKGKQATSAEEQVKNTFFTILSRSS